MKPPPEGGEIVEHDLVAALRSIPDDQRGWQAEKKSVKCQSCQAITVFDPTHVAQRCDFCGSSALIPVEQIKAPIRPESLLEFKIAESEVRDRVRAWYGNVWFAPNALKSRALTDTVRGIYLPYWTFDAQVHADWTAESGYHYYETEYYTDSEGKQQSREVQHTRWEPSGGALDHFFDDELVPGLEGRARAICCARSSRFPRPPISSRTIPASSAAGSSSNTRSTSWPRRKAPATKMDSELQQLCGAAGARRHAIAISR